MRRSWWGPASSSACGWARRRSRRRAVPGRASQSSTSSESWRDRPPAWLLAKVLQDLGGLVQKVGKDKGFTMILERQRSGVLYAAPESDVTDDVLKAYDEETKKAKK